MTTITKKTQLLAALKKATIDTLTVDNMGGFSLTGANLDGATGYTEDQTVRLFPATLAKVGGESETVMVGQSTTSGGSGWSGAHNLTLAVGDTVTLSFVVDPAKTDYKQGGVSKTVTVTAA